MDVRENPSRLEDCGRLFFKALQVKATDDFEIKITENINITSYFMGKAVLLVNNQTNTKKKFHVQQKRICLKERNSSKKDISSSSVL